MGEYIECPAGTMGSQWDAQGENFIECDQRNDTESPECSEFTERSRGLLSRAMTREKGIDFPALVPVTWDGKAPGRAGCVEQRRDWRANSAQIRFFVHVVFEHLKTLAGYI